MNKQEPKPIHQQIIDIVGGKERFKEIAKIKPKQETLEEAAHKNDMYLLGQVKEPNFCYNTFSFIEGAKWQKERMYSKEEVKEQLNLILAMKNSILDTFTDDEGFITMKWFEQFKNKTR